MVIETEAVTEFMREYGDGLVVIDAIGNRDIYLAPLYVVLRTVRARELGAILSVSIWRCKAVVDPEVVE
jgi:hypothetical protein